jgi:hypothetical protein
VCKGDAVRGSTRCVPRKGGYAPLRKPQIRESKIVMNIDCSHTHTHAHAVNDVEPASPPKAIARRRRSSANLTVRCA